MYFCSVTKWSLAANRPTSFMTNHSTHCCQRFFVKQKKNQLFRRNRLKVLMDDGDRDGHCSLPIDAAINDVEIPRKPGFPTVA